MKEINILFDQLYHAYIDDLYAYGKALGVSYENLQDAIHDVFLNVIDHYDNLKLDENIKYYLLKSLKNKIISNARKKVEHDDIGYADESDFSIKITGLELLIEKEERDRLTKKIEKMLTLLTPRQKEAIYLRYMQELSYEEIASMLDITEKGARKLVSRAIIELRGKQLFFLLFILYLMLKK